AWEVAADSDLEEALALSWGEDARWAPRTIAGHEGRVGTVRSDAVEVRVGAVRIGETVYAVQTVASDDAALEAFEVVVGTLARTG
ncbi:MAG: hypothetical protein ACF8XB_24245, partial [Planctomycetota bacterium JB042]